MNQQTFSDIEYSNRKKKTKREEFLDTIDKMIPWEHWIGLIKPYYPSGNLNRFNILFACANLVMCARAGHSKQLCFNSYCKFLICFRNYLGDAESFSVFLGKR